MSLSARIAALAQRIGLEVRRKADVADPGLARAWVSFGYLDNAMVTYRAFNVSEVQRLGAGRYRVWFSTPMPDADYCWIALARSNSNSGTQRTAVVRATDDAKTPQYVDVSCAAGNGSSADTTELNLVIWH